jgi:four helix bundle protein
MSNDDREDTIQLKEARAVLGDDLPQVFFEFAEMATVVVDQCLVFMGRKCPDNLYPIYVPLIDQITRAATGVPKALSEGYAKCTTRHYINNLRSARGSLYEAWNFARLLPPPFSTTIVANIEDKIPKMDEEIRKALRKLRDIEANIAGKEGRKRMFMNAEISKCMAYPIPTSYDPAFQLAVSIIEAVIGLMSTCDQNLYPVYVGTCEELVKCGTAVSSHIIEGFGNSGERRFFMFIRLAKGSIAGASQLVQFLPPPFLTRINAECVAVQRAVDLELEKNIKRIERGVFGADY